MVDGVYLRNFRKASHFVMCCVRVILLTLHTKTFQKIIELGCLDTAERSRKLRSVGADATVMPSMAVEMDWRRDGKAEARCHAAHEPSFVISFCRLRRRTTPTSSHFRSPRCRTTLLLRTAHQEHLAMSRNSIASSRRRDLQNCVHRSAHMLTARLSFTTYYGYHYEGYARH
jgi:hypothetical protein